MTQLRVGFDLDGVLYDFAASVRRYLSSIGKDYIYKDNAVEPHTWNFFEHWGMSTTEFVQHCHDGVDAGFIFRGPARPWAVDAVNRVKASGHKIVVVTDRSFGKTPMASQQATIDWWNENGFPDLDEIYYTSDKTSVPVDIMVEDKIENFVALTEAGTETWLIDRPWNQTSMIPVTYRLGSIRAYPGKVALKAGLVIMADW